MVSLYLPCSLVQPLDASLDSTSVPEDVQKNWSQLVENGKIKQFLPLIY